MTLLCKLLKRRNKAFITLLIALVIQGCSECKNDACRNRMDRNQVAVWSDDNQTLVFSITDYGDKTSPTDNTRAVFTVSKDGTNVSNIYALSPDETVTYYSSSQEYMIIHADRESNRFTGSKEITKLDLSNFNTEILATNDTPCRETLILPSRDAKILAVVEIEGEENGSITSNDSRSSSTVAKLYHGNEDLNIGCHNLVMNVDFIDAITGERIISFINEGINTQYYVYPGNLMSVSLEHYWSDEGFIFNNISGIEDQYYLLKPNGNYEMYDFPEDCYPLKTSSDLLSHHNIEATAIIVFDDGKYDETTTITYNDLSNVSNGDIYQNKSLGKEICIL